MDDNCVHSRNLVPFYNSNEDAKKFSFIANHLEHCSECSKEYKEISSKAEKLKNLIPKVEINKELQKSFESEIVLLLNKTIDKDIKEEKVLGFISHGIVKQVKAVAAALTSRSLVRVYFFAAIYFLVVKSITLKV